MRAWILAIVSLLLVIPAGFAQSWDNDPQLEARINSLLKQMTLEEKLGQMNRYSVEQVTGPGTGRSSYEDLGAHGQVVSLFKITGPRVNELQKIAAEKSRLKIPLIFGLDVIRGFRTIFPTPLALSATWDRRARSLGRTIPAANSRSASRGLSGRSRSITTT